VYVHEDADRGTNIKEKRKKKRKYFREADIFKPLDDENLEMLMSESSHWFYGRGEHIVKQSESGDSVYLILEGSAGVYVEIPGKKEPVIVGHLSSGDFFGEKSLLTGEPRGASVKAESDIEVAEIEKRDIAPILEATPGIAEALSKRLAERQLINEGFFEDAQQNQDVEEARENYSQQFLQGIQSFFGL
jgi:CRP-like cAMP-binding protein